MSFANTFFQACQQWCCYPLVLCVSFIDAYGQPPQHGEPGEVHGTTAWILDLLLLYSLVPLLLLLFLSQPSYPLLIPLLQLLPRKASSTHNAEGARGCVRGLGSKRISLLKHKTFRSTSGTVKHRGSR